MGGSLPKKDASIVPQLKEYIEALRALYLFKVNSEEPDLITTKV
jgi:hypothetical protein